MQNIQGQSTHREAEFLCASQLQHEEIMYRKPSKHHVSCPQANRVGQDRNDLKHLWASVRWKKFRDKHARYPGAFCTHCKRTHGFHKLDGDGKPKFYKTGVRKGRPLLTTLTVNHKNRDKYRTEEEYLTWDEDCEVCCNDCNGFIEQGMKPCPVCSNGGIIRYIHWTQSMCRVCYDAAHPEEARKRRETADAKKMASKALLKKLRAEEKERVKKIKVALKNAGLSQLQSQLELRG
jgi:hypothetical protein